MQNFQTPNPFATTNPAQPPPVLFHFKIYCGILVAMYVFCILLGGLLAFLPQFAPTNREDALAAIIGGAFLGIIGVIFLVASLLPFFVKPQKWVWVYDLVLIVLGFTSCLTMPYSIYLVIHWIKPETKAYFETPPVL